MKNKVFSIFAFTLALVPAIGSAQNLNPVVEISKSYVGKLSETRKPIESMAVPDSLMRFDLDFDYSVFDNPYRGAYIFSPYVVDIKPQKVIPWNRQFHFKAGAGYQFRPELDLFWAPKMGDRFKMNVYAKGQGYMGKYKNINYLTPLEPGGSMIEFTAPRHSGYDFDVRTGVDGYWDWKTGRLLFDVAYSGLHNSDSLVCASYNAMDLDLRMHSNKRQRPYFYYDASMKLRIGSDKISSDATSKGLLPAFPLTPVLVQPILDKQGIPAVWVEDYTTHFMDLVLDGTLGPKFNSESSFMMDFHLGYHRMGLESPSSMGLFSATPRYVLEHNRWKLSAGVKLSTLYKSRVSVTETAPNGFGSYLGDVALLGSTDSQHFYPFFFVGFDAVKDYLHIYFKADGGDQVHDYTSLKQRNHFFNMTSGNGLGGPIANSITQYDFTLGFRGNIAKCFDYDVYGGYKSLKNGLVDVVAEKNGSFLIPIPMMSTFAYQNYKMAYAHADFALDYRNVLMDGYFRYQYTDLYKKGRMGFEPARFMSDIRFRYNWKNRLHVGIEAEGVMARRGYVQLLESDILSEAKLPGFVDLGLSAEFFINRKMSVWLKGDNLLNQTIQRVPLYPEGGIGFTAGICINL